MVLYEAISVYHLLRAILLNEVTKDKHAELLISEGRYNSLNDKLKLYLESKFHKIICYDISYACKNDIKQLKCYFNKKIPNINKFDKIYCGCPHHSFGLYLALSEIDFIYCEDGAGLFSRPEIIINLNKNLQIRQNVNPLYEKYGLYDGTNKNIVSILCNKKAQIENFIDDKKIIDFDVVQCLKELPVSTREEVMDVFVTTKKKYSLENCVLVLSQAYISHEILSFEDTVLLYQLLIDYFFSTNLLIVKAHPDDLLYYKKLFPTCEVLHEPYPAEFLPFLFDIIPVCVATISSTGIHNLKGHFNKCFELNTQFEEMFKNIHKYYIASCLCNFFNGEILFDGVNQQLFDRLLEYKNNKTEYKLNGNVYIVDDFIDNKEEKEIFSCMDKINDNDCIIFINSLNNYRWYDYYKKDIWDNIVPIVINKTIIEVHKEDTYTDFEEEVVYVYSKNCEVLNMAINFQETRELSNSNIKITISKLTEEQERIKVLEGMLAATEKRLLYYIEKEKESK